MAGTYTVSEALTWCGVYQGEFTTVGFSAGPIASPTAQQQWILDNFLVPAGVATNPAGQTGVQPSSTPYEPPTAGSILVADGKGGADWSSGAYVGVITPEAHGAKGDGTTDDTAAIQAALQAAYDAGGGIIQFDAKTYLVSGQLTNPYATGAGVTNGQPIMLLGKGSLGVGQWSTAPTGGTILDMRATAGPAKFDTRGNGTLVARNTTFKTGLAGDTNPFFQTTNTTLKFKECAFVGDSTVSGVSCVQDAIVLGGTTTNNDMTATASFQGYGTIIEDCYFSHVRRGIYGRTYANNVWIVRPTFSSTCGGGSTVAAIDFLGSSTANNQTSGVVIRDPLVEGNYYAYAVQFQYVTSSSIESISAWDGSGVSTAVVHFGTGATSNYASMNFNSMTSGGGGVPFVVEDAAVQGKNSWMNWGRTLPNVTNPSQFAQAVTMTSTLQLSGGAEIDFGPYGVGAGSPDIHLYRISAGNLALVEQFQARGENHNFGNPAHPLTIGTLSSADCWVDASGNNLHLRSQAGNGTILSESIHQFNRALRLANYATTARPAAASAGAGAVYYDTTLSKPGFSDGTNWRDAAGTVI